MSLKIINLQAENIKRIVAIDITPDPYLQIIGGDNAQGKSSVLDAPWLLFSGKDASRYIEKPVREGEDHAIVRAVLGEDGKESYIITRTWNAKGDSKLKIESPDGAAFASPQEWLNSKLGSYSFDPLEFTRLPAKKQLDTLLDIVKLPINLEAMAIERKGLYEQRTDIGRTVKNMEGELSGLGEVEQAPSEIVNVADLLNEVREAEKSHRNYIEELGRRDSLIERKADLERQLTEVKAELQATLQGLTDAEPTLPDLSTMQDQLANAEETNNKVRRNGQRRQVSTMLAHRQSEYAQLSGEIDDLDKEKADALAKAEFPVPGLGFDLENEEVTFNGVPFNQASASEQIRVAIGIAVAMNPKLRVLRIMDGSLLDDKTLAYIASLAKDEDFQIFVERVGNKDKFAIIIEEGLVKA